MWRRCDPQSEKNALFDALDLYWRSSQCVVQIKGFEKDDLGTAELRSQDVEAKGLGGVALGA